VADEIRYTVPEHIKKYLQGEGYEFAWSAMESYIDAWNTMYRCDGSFWNYRETDSDHRTYEIHRRTVKPAKRVSKEWASLILDEETTVNCKQEQCNEWVADWIQTTGFKAKGQELISKAFALGTGAWALWVNPTTGDMKARCYDARMVLPLTWDDDGVTECVFASMTTVGRKRFDQLQLHVVGDDGKYVIRTVMFAADKDGKKAIVSEEEMTAMGIEPEFHTESEVPYFAIVKPGIANTCVEFSPYGESVYADAIDVLKSVDSCYDTVMNEVDLGKLRLFLSDMLFEVDSDGKGNKRAIPFGKSDALMFRKVASNNDDIHEYSPTLRTEQQVKAYRLALMTMGDNCGFGLKYFDIDEAGGIKTAHEVSSDNSALMRNIKKHENALEKSICTIIRAALHCARTHLNIKLPDEEGITVQFDDSIIVDTAAEKAADLAEVGITMAAWEYRVKWYGEDEETARKMAAEITGTEIEFAE